MRITHYKALGFTCYGTLIDRQVGVLEALRPLLVRFQATTSPQWLMAAYRRLTAELRNAAPDISQAALHCQIYRQLARELQIEPDWDDSLAFGTAVHRWPIFEDAPGALQYLSKFYRLILISPLDSGDASAMAARLPVTFDAIVENRGGNLRDALATALDSLRLERSELLPIRSTDSDDPWSDLVDFPLCTLRRRHAEPWSHSEQAMEGRRCEYASLADLVYAHQIALRA
ncbi:haloacid dehalogenase [Pseudomonas sp. LTJR-52]|uniref:haloacid dehalogenase n=1 Tax=Pseudomonas sp. LTJR-52 TaxID=2479392 RepID=UPI000EFD37CA|nr:haloacid dehalogenase [Pseudomonas sp. LTJR-52]AYN96786.1 haloacid dehalogenase [Pseudomonas sp. LTJR-52]